MASFNCRETYAFEHRQNTSHSNVLNDRFFITDSPGDRRHDTTYSENHAQIDDAHA